MAENLTVSVTRDAEEMAKEISEMGFAETMLDLMLNHAMVRRDMKVEDVSGVTPDKIREIATKHIRIGVLFARISEIVAEREKEAESEENT